MAMKVDLEACPCVDGGHWWDRANAVFHTKKKGKLRGIAVRTLVCLTCGSSKDQPLMWNGRIAGAPVYDLSEPYIEAARALGDHHDRGRVYREEQLRRARPTLDAGSKAQLRSA